jgi:hypothetical protein
MTLLGDAPTRRWTGNVLPVLYDPDACLRCGYPVEHITMIQDPLFFHGGYGAARVTVTDFCWACHHSTVRLEQAVRPRSRR